MFLPLLKELMFVPDKFIHVLLHLRQFFMTKSTETFISKIRVHSPCLPKSSANQALNALAYDRTSGSNTNSDSHFLLTTSLRQESYKVKSFRKQLNGTKDGSSVVLDYISSTLNWALQTCQPPSSRNYVISEPASQRTTTYDVGRQFTKQPCPRHRLQ